VPTIRARYKAQRDAMRAALQAHLPPAAAGSVPAAACSSGSNCRPAGRHRAAAAKAVDAGVAYVPGAPSLRRRPPTRCA
jgi:2-aminoadipate transaminase